MENRSCVTCAVAAGNPNEEESYLTLGDGDFSYSLDLCRYMTALYRDESSGQEDEGIESFGVGTKTRKKAGHNKLRITATGIDTPDGLRGKYRDVESIIRKMHALNESKHHVADRTTNNDHRDMLVSVSVHHNVNAILPFPPLTKVEPGTALEETLDASQKEARGEGEGEVPQQHVSIEKLSCKFSPFPSSPPTFTVFDPRHDHVIFNHPHLGIEDAARHARFLSHLFYSVNNYWMSDPGGVFHLTLVMGQCQRWNCLDSARKHGFTLLSRCPFRPPHPQHPVGGKGKCRTTAFYQSRRHQSGRSFASRTTGGSETLTFGRSRDKGSYVALSLPWQGRTEEKEGDDDRQCGNVKQTAEDDIHMKFSCPYCTKSFREERSRKNHIKSAHGDDNDDNHDTTGNNKKRRLINTKPRRSKLLLCDLCAKASREDGEGISQRRTFVNEQALAAHKRAKHSGIHTYIRPDWAASRNEDDEDEIKLSSTKGTTSMSSFGSCHICGLVYKGKDSATEHALEFLPTQLGTDGIPDEGSDGIMKLSHQCSFCSKRFRDRRAQLQHENFCSAGPFGCSTTQ